MANTFVLLLAFVFALQGAGFAYTPQDDTGTTLETGPFAFTVESAEGVEEYAGLTPAAGYQLVDVTITTHNISGETLLLYDSDYSIHWGITHLDWDYCFVALNGEMAPLQQFLAPGESATWHYIYEIPQNAPNPCIAYIVYGEDDAGGRVEEAHYAVFFPL